MSELDRVAGGLRCRDVLALLPDYLEGRLPADLVAKADTHLKECGRCEKFGGEYAALVKELRARRGLRRNDATDPDRETPPGGVLRWTEADGDAP